MLAMSTESATTTLQHIKTPRMYEVVLFNDDFTPMDFVVELLEQVFQLNAEKAEQVMMAVHEQGQAVAGVYTREIAETKTLQALRIAAHFGHPFYCEARPL